MHCAIASYTFVMLPHICEWYFRVCSRNVKQTRINYHRLIVWSIDVLMMQLRQCRWFRFIIYDSKQTNPLLRVEKIAFSVGLLFTNWIFRFDMTYSFPPLCCAHSDKVTQSIFASISSFTIAHDTTCDMHTIVFFLIDFAHWIESSAEIPHARYTHRIDKLSHWCEPNRRHIKGKRIQFYVVTMRQTCTPQSHTHTHTHTRHILHTSRTNTQLTNSGFVRDTNFIINVANS